MSANSGQTTQTGLNGYPIVVNGDIVINTAAELMSALGFVRYTLGPLAPLPVSGTKMLGLAGTITPAATGNFIIALTGDVSNDVGNLVTLQLRYGSGAAPANGATATGTLIGGPLSWQDAFGSGLPSSVTAIGLATGLSVGTTYWIDASLGSSGGNNTMTGATITAYEL